MAIPSAAFSGQPGILRPLRRGDAAEPFYDKEKLSEALALLEGMRQEQYYVRMAVAWAVSICYVKFPRETERLLKKRGLSQFVQNKAIQKIRESRRVSREEKDALLAWKL